MSAPSELLELFRCGSCQVSYLPTDGPCPHCGATARERHTVPALGTVLAATELLSPATGWPSPHRLALVELPGSVRLLAIVEGELPSVGAVVSVRRDGAIYRAGSEPAAAGIERGEGESPRVGATDPSFEPPR